MIIVKKQIRNPVNYLYEFGPSEGIYIASEVNENDAEKLEYYGFKFLNKDTQQKIPIPRKNPTKINADGWWLIHKDLPKVDRIFEHEYHRVDWQGNHHYGIEFYTRKCYQRTLMPPRELIFTLENNILISPLFFNNSENYKDIRLAINIMLEILGRCETWTDGKSLVKPPIKQQEVPWEILEPGTKMKEEWGKYINEVIKTIPQKQRAIVLQRHETLWKQQPDDCVIGSQNFWGYVVYRFLDIGIHIFECNKIDNATYIFKGDWEKASKLTKTEILAGHIQEARLFHTKNWYENIGKLISSYRKNK